MIKLQSAAVGPIQTNCYFAYDDEVKELVICDPGGNAKFIEDTIENLGLKPVAIFLTHSHFDHIGAVEEIRDKYNIPIYVHESDAENLETACANPIDIRVPLTEKDVKLKGGEELNLGGMKINVIHTPGHTPGGTCYYFEDGKFLLAGDTLFCQSWGRTDFPGGDEEALMNSIYNKLVTCLPEDTVVYPGHERSTTIGAELKLHKRLRGER